MEMPPINMLDPFILAWLGRVSKTIEIDGQKTLVPMTHWPDGQPVDYIGVMADDLQKSHPDLVKAGPDGYLTVDYGKLITAQAADFSFT